MRLRRAQYFAPPHSSNRSNGRCNLSPITIAKWCAVGQVEVPTSRLRTPGLRCQRGTFKYDSDSEQRAKGKAGTGWLSASVWARGSMPTQVISCAERRSVWMLRRGRPTPLGDGSFGSFGGDQQLYCLYMQLNTLANFSVNAGVFPCALGSRWTSVTNMRATVPRGSFTTCAFRSPALSSTTGA